MPYWFLTLPVAGTNGAANPSAERDATGWAGTAGGTATRQAGTSAFGAWAVVGTAGAAQGTGVTYGTLAQASGSYTVSAYVYGGSGSVYSIGIKGTGAGAAFVGSTIGTTGGTWHRYSFSYGESGAAKRLFAVVKRSAGADPFLVDGVQVEGGTFLTTYIDGGQDGCTWFGQPHASASSRSGTSRQGGTVISLQSLGLTVLEQGGVGMPPVANIMQEYAAADGALWQRQRATSRALTVTGLMSGTTWPGLHAIRQGVIDAVKINATANPQPVRFYYTGQGGTLGIDAYYDGGMAFDSRNGFSETAALRFLAPDPYWYATTDEGTQLAALSSLGSANYVAYRDPLGRWGTLGVAGVTMAGFQAAGVRAVLAMPTGTVYFAGDFTTAGGTRASGVAMYMPSIGQFGTLNGGTIHNGGGTPDILSLTASPAGSLYIGGAFVGPTGGTTGGANVVSWNGAYGTLPGGTVNGAAWSVVWSPGGSLFAGGAFSTTAGTTSGGVAFHTGANWGTTSGGTANNLTSRNMVFLNNKLYTNGQGFGGSLNALSVGAWDGAWGTTAGTIDGPFVGSAIYAVAVGPDGLVYAGGQYTTFNGGTTNSVAAFNGQQWAALTTGVTAANGTTGRIQTLFVTAQNELYAAGAFSAAGGISTPDSVARWNGAWMPLDADLGPTPAGALTTGAWPKVQGIAQSGDGTLYLSGNFAGTATAASVTAVINDGAADAYPVLALRNLSASNARLYQLVNVTTGDGVWFNTSILPGETITLNLRAGAKTLTSDFRGNLLGAVLPGSNLTSWKLAPGTNYISFFAGTSAVEASLSWRPRAWSQDDRL